MFASLAPGWFPSPVHFIHINLCDTSTPLALHNGNMSGLDLTSMASTSSRLCVKNIPKRCDEKRLKEHFQAFDSSVTDVRVMRAKEGRSRQFGFVGFRTPEQAEAARQHFADSFMDTSKLRVETAKPKGDELLERPWSRHSKGSSAYQHTLVTEVGSRAEAVPANSERRGRKRGMFGNGVVSIVNPHESGKAHAAPARLLSAAFTSCGDAPAEPKLKQFLQLMQPSIKRPMRLWSDEDQKFVGGCDDVPLAWSSQPGATSSGSDRQVGLDGGEIEDLRRSEEDVYQEICVAPHFGVGAAAAEPAAGADSGLDEDERFKVGVEDGSEGVDATVAATDNNSDTNAKQMSDLEYLHSKMIGAFEDEDDHELSEVEHAEEDAKEGTQDDHVDMAARTTRELTSHEKADDALTPVSPAAQALEPLSEHGRLFVRNLPFSCSEKALQVLLETYGPVREMHLPTDGQTRQGKGFAHVRFALGDHALKALAALDGAVFQGRIIHVMEARPLAKPFVESGGNGIDAGGSSFRCERKAQLKEEAGQGHNWNTLFMRSEAVGEAMAARYSLTKGEMLDAAGDSSLAVLLSKGETYMIAEAPHHPHSSLPSPLPTSFSSRPSLSPWPSSSPRPSSSPSP